MKLRLTRIGTALAAAAVLSVGVVRAQVTPAAGYTPPDDTPKINVGITLFANYSYQDTPKVADASPAKTCINPNSFDVTRAYINVTGSLSHWFSFRITPDITRETGTGSSLSGSQTFRIKYGYGQVNFDDFAPRGSWFPATFISASTTAMATRPPMTNGLSTIRRPFKSAPRFARLRACRFSRDSG